MEEKNKSASVRIPIELLETLRRLAREHQRSVSGEVAWALRLYVADQKGVESSQQNNPHSTDKAK